MIDISKTYRTRDGREVRIYAINNGDSLPVHGAFFDGEEWSIWSWWGTGRCGHNISDDLDLIEVKPRIKRTVWLNIYEREVQHETKEAADKWCTDGRIACVKVEIDCEEGEGL
jgi:hypothetical protein